VEEAAALLELLAVTVVTALTVVVEEEVDLVHLL
jgi:hypothetical protein